MLYAVAGSQGSGKSTTLDQLGYPTVSRKTSRSILTDWNVSLSEVNNNHELTVKFQDEILKRKQADEAEFVNTTAITFTERTYADLFIYALVALGKDNQYSDWLDDYYNRCVAVQQQSYGCVFYLTAGHFAPVDDGVRGKNRHYSKMVDLTLDYYTSEMSGKSSDLTRVLTPVLSERIALIKGIVQQRFTQESIITITHTSTDLYTTRKHE